MAVLPRSAHLAVCLPLQRRGGVLTNSLVLRQVHSSCNRVDVHAAQLLLLVLAVVHALLG